jgi:hypothetical protein
MMRTRFGIALCTVLLSTSTIFAATPTTDPVGDAALAEHFAQMAQASLATRAINDTTLTEASALLEAACKLDPSDPRYGRLRAEACLSLQDEDGAIAALTEYTKTADGSVDQVAQCQLIDLYSAKMESADSKMDYFKGLLGSSAIAPEVKAHVGVRMAREQLDRGEDSDARQTLEEALKNNPLDPDGLELNEQLTSDTEGTEHIRALLALLRSNPAQPAVMSRLADELADEGLALEAIGWYSNSLGVGKASGIATDPTVFINYCAELLISNQIKGLDTAIDSYLTNAPNDPQALYLKMLIARRSEDRDAIEKVNDQAREGFLERLYIAYRLALKVDPPTTRPTGELSERTGDVVAQAKQVKDSGNQAAITLYSSALTDLAWFEIYFLQQPQNADKLIAALHVLAPDDDLRFNRLEGWAQLVAKKPAEAKIKLEAIAERDPISAMGLIKIAAQDEKNKEDAKSSARTLVNDNRSGLLAAMLLDGLRDLDAKIEASKDADAIKAALEKFPKAWFSILDNPSNFYVIGCQALQVSHLFDEPMLAIVSFTNIGPFDIAMGPKGTIKPDLWFDVNLRSVLPPQSLSGVAYDRLTGPIVLHAGQKMQQLVRLDQPKLAQQLATNPTVAFTLLFSLVTNPITGPAGVAPGPGGQRVSIKKPVERMANPLNAQRQQQVQQILAAGQSHQKIYTLSLLGTYAQIFSASTDDKIKPKGQELADVVAQMTSDPSAPVASWAKFLQIATLPEEKRAPLIKPMLESEYWPERLVAAASALSTSQNGKEMLQKLADDQEPIVQKFAKAALDDLAAATSQPTSGPATAPSTEPNAAPSPIPAPVAPPSPVPPTSSPAPKVNFGL